MLLCVDKLCSSVCIALGSCVSRSMRGFYGFGLLTSRKIEMADVAVVSFLFCVMSVLV